VDQAFAAAILYILIYAVMNLGAFAVVVGMSREAPGALISDFAGLGKRNPLMAVSMMLFLLSLAGLPPLAGFWAKFFIVKATITADMLWIGLVLFVNSVVSLYYYVSIARQMFFEEVVEARPLRAPALVTGVITLAALAVVAIGFFPDLFANVPFNAALP
jgi:NADH-quinone oxidoreductase subunit N